ncbi:MAG: alpha-galactosidase [Asticcacaulis sp.]|uniref:glycoside hydrolase family 36 protein n=1 Tax=Asticcacaulis sp. TaxID=1872648 RepID=UPI003F7BDE92
MTAQAFLHRRSLLSLLTGAALSPMLMPEMAFAKVRPALPVASAADGVMTIEFDARLFSRVSTMRGGARLLLSDFAPSDFVTLKNGDKPALRIDSFHFTGRQQEAVADAHGAGRRFTITGRSAEGLEKTVSLTFYKRYPGFAIEQVSYRNAGAKTLEIAGWSNGAHMLKDAGHGFWSWSGSSHEDRRDWVQPVKAGFDQPNFMGMNASDYGSGTPVVDVWRPDAGLAVGHVEPVPKLVSLPLIATRAGAGIAVSMDHAVTLKPGDSFTTLDTFVTTHRGDYFVTLDTYRQVMAERGLAAPKPPAASYEGIWCAWGYDRVGTPEEVEGTLAKAADLGLGWAVLDDGWQTSEGDWYLNPKKFPRGDADMRDLSAKIKAAGLKARLWITPLAVDPGTDLLHDHSDMLLLDQNGAPQLISWWNSFYLCPAYQPTIDYTEALFSKIFRDWGFDGVKIDGQHLNGVAPCYNPLHNHAYPDESVEKLQTFWKCVYDTAQAAHPDAVVEICPCGDCYSFFNFPYMNNAPASDPTSSWQVRLKGKSLKALMGPSAAFSGDHVELSDGGDDFASTVGIGGIVSTKFTWPHEGRAPGSNFLLTPEKEALWRKWIALYNEKKLPQGAYRGELYDIGFDKPEAHVVEKDGRLHYAFYAEKWRGPVELRGLKGAYRVRDYFNDRDLGAVSEAHPHLDLAFEHFLVIEAIPAGEAA